MTETLAHPAAPGVEGAPAPDDCQGDWETIWQSELAALAVDREWQEGVQLAAAGWATLARAGRDASGRPGADAAAGATPAAVAPDARDAELARLRTRITELERAARGA